MLSHCCLYLYTVRNHCSVQLVNDGFTVDGNVVTAEFVGVGDTDNFEFLCTACNDEIPCKCYVYFLS